MEVVTKSRLVDNLDKYKAKVNLGERNMTYEYNFKKFNLNTLYFNPLNYNRVKLPENLSCEHCVLQWFNFRILILIKFINIKPNSKKKVLDGEKYW